jgi:hypothetical protein
MTRAGGLLICVTVAFGEFRFRTSTGGIPPVSLHPFVCASRESSTSIGWSSRHW